MSEVSAIAYLLKASDNFINKFNIFPLSLLTANAMATIELRVQNPMTHTTANGKFTSYLIYIEVSPENVHFTD